MQMPAEINFFFVLFKPGHLVMLKILCLEQETKKRERLLLVFSLLDEEWDLNI